MLLFKNKYFKTELDLGQKLNKIYLARKELETNLFIYHAKITEYISANDRPANIETSERRREAALAKIRRKEVERQAEANLRLKKQEIQNQSMKGQLELDVVVEESRLKLAEATIEEAEYLEDASEICGFRRSRSKLAMAVQENQTEEDRTRSWVNTQFPVQEIVQPLAPVQSINLEPVSEFLSFSSIEPPFSRNLALFNSSHPNAKYFETMCINSQSVNVPNTSNTSVSLPNLNVNSTYEPQKQLPLTNLYNYNPLMQSSFHHSNIPTSSMPIAQHTFFTSNSANFVYQLLLPTNVGPLNPPTVNFSPNSFYLTQPSNVQPSSSGGTTFYVGDLNAVDAAIYSKPLMAPYTNENKQYGPITSSGSKPITNQDLAEILTLSQKGPLPEWKLSSFDGNPLQWPEWFSQFKSTIDAKVLSDDVKLTYLKTLVSGKAKYAIAEFAYSGVFCNDALKTLERKFGQPQTIVAAHLEKLLNIPPLKMHNSESIISFASCISSLVAVLKSLGYEYDLKSTSQLNELNSPHRIGCVLLAFNLTTCSENALKPASALSLAVKAPIMSCCMVLRNFSA